MKEPKFTKGEWVVDITSSSIFIENEDGIIAESYGVSDAHLIASAPEMYEELERDITELKRFVSTLKEYSNDWLFYTNELKRKVSILAKARGE